MTQKIEQILRWTDRDLSVRLFPFLYTCSYIKEGNVRCNQKRTDNIFWLMIPLLGKDEGRNGVLFFFFIFDITKGGNEKGAQYYVKHF